jgi:hypothetical protein
MTTETNYRHRITQCNTSDLIRLWEQIQIRATSGWDPGKALEYLVIRAFEIEGAAVTYPFAVRMGGSIVEQIDVWDEHDLNYALRYQKMREGLIEKYRYCIELGLPLCNLNTDNPS